VGLVDDRRWARFEQKQAQRGKIVQLLEQTRCSAVPEVGCADNPTLLVWLRRPEARIGQLERWICAQVGEQPAHGVLTTVETEAKYSGYIAQQERQIKQLEEAESRQIPAEFTYRNIPGLSNEVKQKLERVRPTTLGQARRIPGVTPAAIAVLDIYLNLRPCGVASPSD
jgi:tRNA uridine 5-carboxymethylaminomethyl modification enzyme